MAARREGLSDSRMIDRLYDVVMGSGCSIIAAVWPLPGEVDLRPLCVRLCRAGRRVVLPETPPKGHPLVFREWVEGAEMREGLYGTMYPDGPHVVPDLVLVPFLAFDRRGYRLGYGGGYYDRTLAQCEVMSIGFGLACQEVAQVPVGPYDVSLSMIVTEAEIICVGDHGFMKD